MSVLTVTAEEFEALADKVAELEARPAVEPWPEHMSVETAARYLDMTREALRKLVQRRKVAYSQECKGGRLSFARIDLDEFARRHRVARAGEVTA